MKYRSIAILGLLLVSTVSIAAQTQTVTPEINYSEIFSTNTNARKEEIRWTFSGTGRRTDDFSRCSVRQRRMSETDENLLSLNMADKTLYKNFLKQKNTGLIRLLPREKYVSKLSVFMNGGASYSFICKQHKNSYASDILFENGSFFAGGAGYPGTDFGMILNLGDVPIENVTKDLTGVKFMFEFKAPSKENEAKDLYKKFNDGVSADGFVYKRQTAAVPDNTYVFRSVNYSGVDVLVAFRVVRQDADGSITILWKRLKRFSLPDLN